MRIKLFENFKESEFFHSIKDCFSDLIDDSKVEIEVDEDEVIVWMSIKTNFRTTNINDFLQCKEEEFSIIRDVKLALKRIVEVFHIDYDIDCEFDVGEDDYQLVLRLTPGLPKEGEFYKETKLGIKFNYSKLKEILKLPRDVEISLSSGSGYRLNFRFRDKNELERYKDKLIEDFMKLKIDGESLSGNVEWSWSTATGAEIAPYKVYKNYKRQYVGTRGRGEETINSVEFGLNNKLEFNW
jgi:hypothetical protein